MRRSKLSRGLTLALILYFWASGVAGLDRLPPVHEDEPWIAAPGYDFWETGHFGATMFAGFYGMETHYYTFPPLFSMTVGGALQLFGMGLFQARVVPLMCMMLTLALTYRLGTKIFSEWHGLIAVAVLVGWRMGGALTPFVTDIPLGDVARIARYDAAIPVFGLCALWFLLSALRRPATYKFFGAGVCAGLAMLCHLYGGFWLVALLIPIMLVVKRQKIRYLFMTLVGFGLTLTPWILFIVSGWDDYVNQNRRYGGQFNLSGGNYFAGNLLNEGQRYQPILDMAQTAWGARLALILLVIGLLWLLRRKNPASQLLLLVTASLIALFALVSPVKTFSYLATVWPLLALMIAAGWFWLWSLATKPVSKRLLVLLFVLLMVEGGASIWRVQNIAAKITAYRVYTEEIAALLPANSRAIGLQHYWFGLADQLEDYRSILTFINWTNPSYVQHPITFSAAVGTFPANILLIDQHMLDFLQEASRSESGMHYLVVQMDEYLRAHHALLIGNLWDATYGRCLIYLLDPLGGT
ncbi:MAG: glycosyltransferase family 39 protein [Chloroflexota bacterium]